MDRNIACSEWCACVCAYVWHLWDMILVGALFRSANSSSTATNAAIMHKNYVNVSINHNRCNRTALARRPFVWLLCVSTHTHTHACTRPHTHRHSLCQIRPHKVALILPLHFWSCVPGYPRRVTQTPIRPTKIGSSHLLFQNNSICNISFCLYHANRAPFPMMLRHTGRND